MSLYDGILLEKEYLVDKTLLTTDPCPRLSWEEYGCLLALMAKSRAEDPFSKIGGVALNQAGRVLGASYNGLKTGEEFPEWMTKEENRVKKSSLVIHCEANLCAQLTKDQCYLLCLTQSPCIMCCQNIAALNVKRVVYLKEYERCNKFKEFFDFHKIEYMELDATGKLKIKNYLLDQVNFKELD